MKRALIITLLAIAVIGVALPYAPVDSFLKAPMERALARGLGRKVELDRVSLTLFSGPGVSLDGVTIHEDRRAGIEPFAYANTLDARVSLLALLRGRLEFASLHLNDATFNLVKPNDAPWNFQMLLNQTSATVLPASLPRTSSATLPLIKMRGGRVNFKFSQTKSPLYFDDTDLDVSPREDGSIDLRFSGVPARTDRSAQNFGHFFVRGTATPSAAGQQLNLRVELEPSALDSIARLLEAGNVALNGVVSLDAQVSGVPNNLDVKGTLDLESAGQWRVGYKGRLDLVGQTLELDSTSPAGLNTRLHASTRDLLTTPRWEISAEFLDAPLASVVEMVRKLGAPLPEKMTAEGVIAGSIRYRNNEGLGGNVEIRDASVIRPEAVPLKIPTATVFLKGSTIMAGPNTVNVGEKESAEIQATYQTGEGGGGEVKIATRRMNLADLRALTGSGTIPLLDRVSDGTWRGSLVYVSTPGSWTGDFDVQNTRVAVDGIADPVQIQSALISAKDEYVAVTRIRAKVGAIAFAGDYRWDTDKEQPHRFHLQIADAEAKEVERLFQPTTSREGGLLARTLRLGAAGATPDWLTQRNGEGTISIRSLTAAGAQFSIATARLVWDGTTVKVSGIQGKAADAPLSGELQVDLSGRAPAYRFDGKLKDLAYKGGKADFSTKGEGILDTEHFRVSVSEPGETSKLVLDLKNGTVHSVTAARQP